MSTVTDTIFSVVEDAVINTVGGPGVVPTPPFFARGMAYSDAFAVTNTTMSQNTWTLLNVTTLTDAFNEDFTHNGNGELEYTGAATANFEGEILTGGRRNAGSGAASPIFDIAPTVDSGSGYILGTSNTFGSMETARQPETGFICKYSVTLDPGDKVRMQARQNPNGLGTTHSLYVFGLDHSLIVRP